MAAKTAAQEYVLRKRNIISKLAGINTVLKKHAKKRINIYKSEEGFNIKVMENPK